MEKFRITKIILGHGNFCKVLFIFKLSVLFILLTLVRASASIYSENTRLNLKLEDATFIELFSCIKQQSEFTFIYNVDDIENLSKITCEFQESTVEQILDQCLENTDMTYYVRERVIILSLKDISDYENRYLLPVQAQLQKISGRVTDSSGQPLPGVSIILKGTTQGTVTDFNGEYSLSIDLTDAVLVFSFIGMKSQEIELKGRILINVTLEETTVAIEDVVVVGYGLQKRESLVGSITTANAEILERRGGTVNLATALSGQLPGVTVMSTTGEPGKEDPLILIRGQSTWNEATPLILVDGVERRMNDIDVNEVESISVLKDASATAVFGVKGANGVILITTKRGQVGKAQLSVNASNTFKSSSKAENNVLEAFTAQQWKNAGIEHEVVTNETSWAYYIPYEESIKFQKPQEYSYLYPNIDWKDVILKDYATTQKFNVNVSGGTEVAKYFGSVGYTHEGDILNSGYNEFKHYDPSFTYDRINFRGNIDFKVTSTTQLSVGLSGFTGSKKETNTTNPEHSSFTANSNILRGIYAMAPDAFPPKYEDGMYGHDPAEPTLMNPMAILNDAGVNRYNRMFVGSDFKLDQELDFIIKGLSAHSRISFDNYFASIGATLKDGEAGGMYLRKFVDPSILDAKTAADSLNAIIYTELPGSTSSHVGDYDWVTRPWVYTPERPTAGSLRRVLFYQLSLNYDRTFGNHDFTSLFLFSRRKDATGSSFPSFQEDWVGRITYDYKDKYLFEANGAYNGSEKFGPGYRFGFFPSVALGWMISNESFMNFDWLNKFKIRASIGVVGSDAGIPRWGYLNSWKAGSGTYVYGDASQMEFGTDDGVFDAWNWKAFYSMYPSYHEGTIANPDINWETVLKKNIGLEIAVLKNKLSFELDLFDEKRSNIFMSAMQRNIPVYFGAPPVPANLGETETKGYELGIAYRNKLFNGLEYWTRVDITRVNDLTLKAEDPKLLPTYMKSEGFAIGQSTSQIYTDIATSWDDVYAQTSIENPTYKLPGDWDIIDFNGDGLISSLDNAPFAFPNNRPQNTYSTFLGIDYKGFSFLIQFYGVTNITNYVSFYSPKLERKTIVSNIISDYWSLENPDASFRAPRVGTSSPTGNWNLMDGSYLRLKTAEIAYSLPSNWINPIGLSQLRLFINGNNLFYWSKLPVDIEAGSFSANQNAYPQMRFINIGLDLTF